MYEFISERLIFCTGIQESSSEYCRISLSIWMCLICCIMQNRPRVLFLSLYHDTFSSLNAVLRSAARGEVIIASHGCSASIRTDLFRKYTPLLTGDSFTGPAIHYLKFTWTRIQSMSRLHETQQNSYVQNSKLAIVTKKIRFSEFSNNFFIEFSFVCMKT